MWANCPEIDRAPEEVQRLIKEQQVLSKIIESSEFSKGFTGKSIQKKAVRLFNEKNHLLNLHGWKLKKH